MTIDIIDLNDPKYADLSPVQLAMVRAAQVRKNKLEQQSAADAEEVLGMFIANNTVRSAEYGYRLNALGNSLRKDIEALREDLEYQLAYEALGSEGNENGPYRYPENPNYNLTPSQRFLVVRNYYMEITDDPVARLEAFRGDTLARAYLGEFYQTLYDLLASYI